MLSPAPHIRLPGSRWPQAMLLVLIYMLIAQPRPLPLALPSLTSAPEPVAPAVAPDFGKLPLSFVPNAGQTDPSVRFQARGMGGTIFFQADGAVLALPVRSQNAEPERAAEGVPNLVNPQGVLRPEAAPAQAEQVVVEMRFLGANPAPMITGDAPLPGIVNYFLGNDPTQWRTNLPTYRGIVYQQLYAGIDLQYDGAGGRLKGTYTVAPGVDPAQIRWRYAGAADVQVDAASGDLRIALPSGSSMIERAPIAWQDIDGQRVAVSARFAVDGEGNVGFALGAYNPAHSLTIDPILEYSTYLGGSGNDFGRGIAVDSVGDVYITGETTSTNFPTANPLQLSFSGGDNDAFIAKLDSSGTSMLFSTYIGGSGADFGLGIAVDSAGNVYVTGQTYSANFPTANPLQPTFGGAIDAFIAKLNPTGTSLRFSTYLGGSNDESGHGIAVDSAGNVVITGQTYSANFPTANPLQPSAGGSSDAFIAKLNSSGTNLLFSTYLGGSNGDQGEGIAVDSAGNVYITGVTFSPNFPTANPLQSGVGSYGDAFIAKFTPTGTSLLFSTYLGGSSGDIGQDIAVDSEGNVYLTGYTYSGNFPAATPLQPIYRGESDAFVAKLNPSGTSLLFSIYLGGSSSERGEGIAVDSTGNVYVTGNTNSANFPTANPLQPNAGGAYDAFIAKLSPSGTNLLFSTYLGGSNYESGHGIAVDSAGNVVITGYTYSANFPTANPLQPNFGGGKDAFIAKLSFAPRLSLTATASTSSVAYCIAAPCASVRYSVTLNAMEGALPAELAVTLPQGLELVAGSVRGGARYDAPTRQVRFADTVVPGAPVAITYDATVQPAVPPGSPLITAASAAGGGRTLQQSVPVSVLDNDFGGSLVLIYASSNNDLASAMLALANAAEQGAGNLNTVALLLLDGPGSADTYLTRLQPSTPSQPCLNRYLDPTCGGRYRMGESIWFWPVDDLGDPANLTAFVTSAQRAYPNATNVILSLVGHGGGWSPSSLGGQPSGHVGQPGDDPLGGMLWDDAPGSSLSTPELGAALRASKAASGRGIDLLFLDACNMAMAEVAYEVRDSARYLLASANWKWAGFPYDRHLEVASIGDALVIGRAWLNNEAAYIGGFPGEPYTYALLNLAELDTVRARTDTLADALMREGGPLATTAGRTRVEAASQAADRFDSSQDGAITPEDNYVDLLTFARALAAQFSGIDEPVVSAASTLAQALTAAIEAQEFKSGTPWPYPGQQWSWKAPGGLSIYLPLHTDDWRRRYYGRLQFTQDGQWATFVNAWWENRVPPNDPACPPDCGLPPAQLQNEYKISIPMVHR